MLLDQLGGPQPVRLRMINNTIPNLRLELGTRPCFPRKTLIVPGNPTLAKSRPTEKRPDSLSLFELVPNRRTENTLLKGKGRPCALIIHSQSLGFIQDSKGISPGIASSRAFTKAM
jgi:hypothetical protein